MIYGGVFENHKGQLPMHQIEFGMKLISIINRDTGIQKGYFGRMTA